MIEHSIDETYGRILNWNLWEIEQDDPGPKAIKKAAYVPASSRHTEPHDPDDAENILEPAISKWKAEFDQQANGEGSLMFKCLLESIRNRSPWNEQKARRCGVSERKFNSLRRKAVGITHIRLNPDQAPKIIEQPEAFEEMVRSVT